MKKAIGFIGTGNMGGSIAKAVAKCDVKILLSDFIVEKADALANEIGGKRVTNSDIAREADVIFLGVKPQVLTATINEIKEETKKRPDVVFVSMAAGVTTSKICEAFGYDVKLIRIMPNTPVGVGKGMVLYTALGSVNENEKALFLEIMKSAGEIDEIPEALIDAGSAVSGCGPAFVYMFIEAMADGGVAAGLPRDKAIKYATETLIGSAELLKASGKHPEELKDAVCSPSGSTIEGVRALENGGMRAAVINAITDAYNRTKELGK